MAGCCVQAFAGDVSAYVNFVLSWTTCPILTVLCSCDIQATCLVSSPGRAHGEGLSFYGDVSRSPPSPPTAKQAKKSAGWGGGVETTSVPPPRAIRKEEISLFGNFEKRAR